MSVLLTLSCFSCKNNDKITKLTVSEVTHSLFYTPQYAAIALGLFKEEDIEIELINGGGADKVMTSVLSGEAQIGLAGPEASIYVMKEGKKNHPIIFAQLTKRDGSFIVGREETEFSWDILKDKTIIGGRKGGVPEMTLEYVLKENGLTPGIDINVDTSVAFDLMAGSFTSGNGDLVTLFEPTASLIEKEGKGYVIASVGEVSGEIPYTAYFASSDYINKNSEVIQKFTNVIAKAQKWIMETDSEKIAELLLDFFPDSDIEILASSIERYKEIDAWNENPVMKKEAFERLEDVIIEAGELDAYVDFDKVVDNSFAKTASE